MSLFGVALTPAGLALVGLAGILCAATALIAAMKVAGKPQADELLDRVRTWWMLFAFVAVALAIGRTASIALLAFVSFLALKEYFSLIPTRRADRLVLLVAYLAIPIQYVLIAYNQYGIFIVFVPVYMLMAVPAAMVVRGETTGFLRATATIHWGLMACVFAVGHAAALLTIDEASVGRAEFDQSYGAALFLVLLILTGLNDVAQYVAGKLFGRTPISPTVSPNKTRAGFLGGVVATAAAAALLAPWLTPFSIPFAAALGAGLAVIGFFGDLTLSAVKRDLGIKDTGSVLPGHGGILDRIDSLVFTAPLFFHATRYFYF